MKEFKKTSCFWFQRASLSIKSLVIVAKGFVKGAKHRFIISGLKLLSGLKMVWMSLSFLLPYTDVRDRL